METGDPGATRMNKRQEKSASRLKEYQQRKRLERLRRTLWRAVKRLRFDRMWRVHNEWYASRPSPAPQAHDSCDTGEATSPMEAEAPGATREEATEGQRPEVFEFGSEKAETAGFEFVPGLPNAEVESAWRGAAATWSMGSATTPNPSRGPGARQPRKARRTARG